MKNITNILLGILLIIPSLFISCDDDYKETDRGNQPLTLSADNTSIQLDVTAPQSNAITFEWTPGSNFNTNAAITYTFELALSGTDFSKKVALELTQGKTSVSYKTEELNKIILDQLGAQANSNVELEARVTAKVLHENVETQTSGILKITVKTYKPVSPTLYMIGSAAPNGWSADNATKMNTVSGAAGGFIWQGKLNAGELKFITTLGGFLPSYNKGSDNTKLSYRESENDPDEKFTIPATGIYKISVNIINLTINIETLDAPEYSELWLVGNPTGWNFKAMTVDPSDPFVFHYNADLSAGGDFKIATAQNWDAAFFRPAVDKTGAGKNLEVSKWAGDPDNKWNIAGGVYKIKLDTRDMKIDIVSFSPYKMVYLVGDASPNGWSIDNATPMSAVSGNPYKFTWTGNLNGGDLKFTCDKKNDWNGDWFLASENGKEPTGASEQMIFSAGGANPDNKWKITKAGTYTIELDQLQQTVTIKK